MTRGPERLRLYWGFIDDPRVKRNIARMVVRDRETAAEMEVWEQMSEWERRHYATIAVEDLRAEGRLE